MSEREGGRERRVNGGTKVSGEDHQLCGGCTLRGDGARAPGSGREKKKKGEKVVVMRLIRREHILTKAFERKGGVTLC